MVRGSSDLSLFRLAYVYRYRGPGKGCLSLLSCHQHQCACADEAHGLQQEKWWAACGGSEWESGRLDPKSKLDWVRQMAHLRVSTHLGDDNGWDTDSLGSKIYRVCCDMSNSVATMRDAVATQMQHDNFTEGQFLPFCHPLLHVKALVVIFPLLVRLAKFGDL